MCFAETSRQQRHKFAYSTTTNNGFTRFARIFFIPVLVIAILAPSTTWNDLIHRCVDTGALRDNFSNVLSELASIMTWDNLDMMAETASYIFRWCSRCHDTVSTFMTSLDHVSATGGSFIRYQNTWRYYSKLTGAAKTITWAYEVTDSDAAWKFPVELAVRQKTAWLSHEAIRNPLHDTGMKNMDY